LTRLAWKARNPLKHRDMFLASTMAYGVQWCRHRRTEDIANPTISPRSIEMSRIAPVDRNTPNESVRRIFDAVQKQLGVVPNMMRAMAQSPQVLEGYLGLNGALRRGLLPAALQEQIALAVAEVNECDYCLSAHTALGRGAGLSDGQLAASREAHDADPKVAAALQFARAVTERRGGVSDQELARIRAAGFTEGEIAEIIAHVALNVFTNYFNRAASTDIDFPKVTAGQLA
jgi:uncharacterized peroxidase-related enzyme